MGRRKVRGAPLLPGKSEQGCERIKRVHPKGPFIGGPRRLCPCLPSLATEKKPAIGRKLGFESTLFEGAFFMSRCKFR